MKIYNAMTGKKENFVPIEENKVRMYACGITVFMPYRACKTSNSICNDG